MRIDMSSSIDLVFISILTFLQYFKSSECSRTMDWGQEALGNYDSIDSAGSHPRSEEINTYKQNLLHYVLQTDEPGQVGTADGLPYVMDKLYDLIADKYTGKHKRSSPFDVDVIRGLEDHYRTQRRMEFWFNTSKINTTEDLIECSLHVYKRIPLESSRNPRSRGHMITVSLYKIQNEDRLFTEDGEIGEGGLLLERQRVSAYTSQWLVFKSNLKEVARQWIRHPIKNKGLLLTATDPDNNHVNGTHIDFVQKGEFPQALQPVFVVYTDKEKKKNNKHKKKHRKNINYLIENFLNEDTRTQQANRNECLELTEDNSYSDEECTELLFRHRRSLIDPSIDIEEEIVNLQRNSRDLDNVLITEPEELSPHPHRHRRDKNLQIQANSRNSNEDFCHVKPLYISFEALGWGRWIVAPDGLNANFCDGTCPFPLTSALTANNHAILQSVSNYYHPNKVKPPCCVPQKLARMSILYYQDEDTVTMRNYDDMIVETCGCR